MKIIEINKKKRFYEIKFDNDEVIDVLEDVVVKHLLIKNKVISILEFQAIKEDELFFETISKTIKYLHKPRFISDVKTYLKKSNLSVNKQDEVVEYLIKMRYIDDYKTSITYLNYYLSEKKGMYFIKNFLIKKDVKTDIIDLVLKDYDDEKALNNLNLLFQSHLKNKAKKSKNLVINSFREIAYLKGYSKAMINEVLINNQDKIEQIDDIKRLKFDLEKCHLKYKNKYEGYQLKQKIIQSLLTKGYNYDDIIDSFSIINL